MKLGEKLADKLREIMPLVRDLDKLIGKEIETVLKLTSKRLQISKDGKKFLLMTLSDRTGDVRAVDWYNAEENDARLKEGSVLKVKGKVVYFEERVQINVGKEIDSVKILKPGEYDPERFVRRSDRDPKEIYSEVMKMVESVRDHELRKLLKVIFEDLKEDFLNAPAAMKNHHAYIGGLIEHSLTVAKMVDFVSRVYDLNRDLAVAGALLHDIGKIREYRVGPSGIELTTEGELKGHIVMGAEMVRDYGKKLRISQEKVMELEHIILSHHGEHELGSPVVPKTPEALVVHFIENMDSKVARMMDIVKGAGEKEWSDYDRSLGRRVLVKRGVNRDGVQKTPRLDSRSRQGG